MKTTLYYSLLVMIISMMMALPSYSQNCTFDDPQKQAEYDFLVEFYEANPTYSLREDQGWIDLINGSNCEVCNLFTAFDFASSLVNISCNENGYITNLSFNNTSTTTIPASIGNLSELQILSLGSNDITTLPESIGNLSSLKQLYLITNPLTFLPSSIGNLNNLELLDLRDNYNITSLPSSIGNLNNLITFYLTGSEITSLPESFGNLSSLQRLLLIENPLETLPESFGNLSNLTSISAGPTNLIRLPESFGNLTNLEYLYLVNSPLTSLPESFGNLTNLESIIIRNNYLTSLPESFGNLSKLRGLDLRSNEISTLPESIGNLSSIESLIFYNNDLICLPAQLKNLCPNNVFFGFNSNPIESLYSDFSEFCDAAPTTESCADSSNDDIIKIQENLSVCAIDGTIAQSYERGNRLYYINTFSRIGAGIDWAVNAGSSGSYRLVWRYTNGSSSTLTARVLVNGSEQIANLNFGTTGGCCPGDWDAWTESSDNLFVSLSEGNNIIRLEATQSEGLPNIDWIEIYADNADIDLGNCDNNDGGGSEPFLTGNTGNETCTVWIDSDGDGVCDEADVCQGGDDYIDTDQNGIPDACDDDGNASGGTSLTIEENRDGFCRADGPVESNHSGASGGFINTDNFAGAGIEWAVNVENSGSYLLEWRYANGTDAPRPTRLLANDVEVASSIDFPSTGAWSTWDRRLFTVNLISGNNIIRLEALEVDGLANIDFFRIVGTVGIGTCNEDDNNDPYLTGNTGNEPCSVWIDSDNDGICDDADICEGGDDYIDTNNNGIPDACDEQNTGGDDPYLTGNTGNELCSVWIDSDNDGVCDDADICEGGDDYMDADTDGIPDACDSDTQARIAQPERLIAEKQAGRKVKLTWAANEANLPTLYTIQHSSDGEYFTDLLTVSPRDNDKIEVYYDQHNNPSIGNNFYRLKIDYLEKRSQYYEDAPIYFIPTGIAAFPNPTKDVLHVNLSEIMGSSASIRLFTIHGVELNTIEIDANHEEVIDLDMRPYNNGLYTLTIKPNGFRAISQKVVISNID